MTETETATPTLRQLVERVQFEREMATRARETLAALRAEFEDYNALAIARVKDTAELLAQAEAELRAAAVQAFNETSSKAPVAGVTIKVMTRMVYDREAATQWAKDHDIALTLDVKAFEQIAKHGACGSIVTFNQEPQAQIASDLSKVLNEA